LERSIQIVAFIRYLNPRFLAPEDVGTKGNEAMRGVPVSDTTNNRIHSEDFLKYDYAWAITTGGQGEVSVELTAVE
jgi:hypothetical protein